MLNWCSVNKFSLLPNMNPMTSKQYFFGGGGEKTGQGGEVGAAPATAACHTACLCSCLASPSASTFA